MALRLLITMGGLASWWKELFGWEGFIALPWLEFGALRSVQGP